MVRFGFSCLLSSGSWVRFPPSAPVCTMLKLEDLAVLLAENREAADARVQEFALDDKFFAFNSQPGIMGVINTSGGSWGGPGGARCRGAATGRAAHTKE